MTSSHLAGAFGERSKSSDHSFPGGSDGKESAHSEGYMASIHGQEYPLEEEMATHSRILAWRIPWTERSLVGLQSIGVQRIGHAQVTKTLSHTHSSI